MFAVTHLLGLDDPDGKPHCDDKEYKLVSHCEDDISLSSSQASFCNSDCLDEVCKIYILRVGVTIFLQEKVKPVVSQSVRFDSSNNAAVNGATDITSLDGSISCDAPLAGMVN